MNQFLTRDEVAELTGSSTKAGQQEILKRNGLMFSLNKFGWPMITWFQVNLKSPFSIDVVVLDTDEERD